MTGRIRAGVVQKHLKSEPVTDAASNCDWLATGDETFASMLQALAAARNSICLESYTFAAGQPGERFRDALVDARRRGLRVRVLIDALGSYGLPADFWAPLWEAGGEARLFNPIALYRLGLRDHRKLLVCDERVAFVGGFNIAPEYLGDGVECGWCDLGLRIEGPLVGQLAESFEDMFARADFRHKRFPKLRKRTHTRKVMGSATEQLLLSGPGRGRNPFQRALGLDLAGARSVQIIAAYFLPPWRLRRQLGKVAQRGGKVQLILGGKSDVAVALLAARSLYRRLLKAGIDISEYQPQILHAKLLIVDDVVYVGSANLDQRSLKINYELVVRFESKELARQARELFEKILSHCQKITLPQWRETGSFWRRVKQHWAYFLLVRVDPYVARRQWKALPD